MMNEIMQIVAEKETITKELQSAEIKKDLKKLRKLYYRFYITYQRVTALHIHLVKQSLYY